MSVCDVTSRDYQYDHVVAVFKMAAAADAKILSVSHISCGDCVLFKKAIIYLKTDLERMELSLLKVFVCFQYCVSL